MTSATPKPRAGEHTPAPWRVSAFDGDTVVVADGTGEATVANCLDTGFVFLRQANARRIVACVNACEGISNEMLADRKAFSAPDSWLRALEAERDSLRERERELVEALRGVLSIEDTVTRGQESERRAEWLPKARALLAKHGR